MGNKEQELSDRACPVCDNMLPKHSRGRTFHAKSHNLTPEMLEIAIIGGRPTCDCGCGNSVNWVGGSTGFAKFIPGHMSSSTRATGTEKLKKHLEQHHWARGLKKETSSIIQRSSGAISATLKEGFLSGRIAQWSSGKSSNDDPRIAAAAKKRSETIKGKNHWNFMGTDVAKERIKSSLSDKFCVLSGFDDLDNRENNRQHELIVACTRCSQISSFSVYDVIRSERKRCQSCDTIPGSVAQGEIEAFVGSLGIIDVRRSDRTNPTGFELDVYVPSASFAIEYNGLYWHSDAIINDKNYHGNKTAACSDNGIKLLHIFEDEWRDKRQLVESMIKNRLGLSKKIGARACSIVEVTHTDAKEFFDANHIDGDTRGFKTYALIYNKQIMAAIKLRRPYSSVWHGHIEVARFSTLQGHVVIGGYSRLLRYITNNHCEKVFTYVDTRLGSDGGYCAAAGMKFHHTTGSSFWWTDRERRFNRLHCTAGGGQSEKDRAKTMKLLKIWGCPNLVFVA